MQKKITHILIALLLGTAGLIKAADAPKVTNGPAMHFTEVFHDFGDIELGQVVTYTFTFKNTGAAPLVIQEVEKPCGCTIPEWPKEPIMPGKTGEIKVTFDTTQIPGPGAFRKSLQIKSNTTDDAHSILLIKGVVVKAPKKKTNTK